METRRTPSPAIIFPRSVAISESDLSPRSPDSLPASHAPLAVAIGSLVVLLLVSGAFWCGRMVEQRTQLGYLVAAAPALEDLTAATRFQDSVSMQYVIRMGRMKKQTPR